jgi:hypothetical protein
MRKIFYYYTKEKIIPKDLFKNYKKFKESKELFESEVRKADSILNQIKIRDEMINDAFIHALMNYKEEENSNFNYIFSSEISHRLARMKNKEKNLDKYVKEEKNESNEKYVDKKILLEFIIKTLRKMKDREKFYFSLKYSINFEKPKDKNEETINILVKKKYIYDEINTIGFIFFNKRMTRQGIESNIKRTIKRIEKEISINKEIKNILEKCLN